jgi:hypothetical protein
VPEAKLEQTDDGIVPKTDGWFVVNARDARWTHHDDMGSAVTFEGEAKFRELGINIGVAKPGSPAACITARTRRRTSSCSRVRRCS